MVTNSLKRYARLLRVKSKATFLIWKTFRSPFVVETSPEAVVRSEVLKILIQRINPQSEQHQNILKATADEIVLKICQPSEDTVEIRSLKMLEASFHQAHWFHSQLSGLTATWEFKIRFLGIKLGIFPNVPIDRKSKENRNKKSIQHRTLSETISEIHRITGGRLNLKLVELAGLRDAIVHCNPQGMRAYSQSVFGKDKIKNLRGNVMVMNLGSKDIKNMSDIEEEIEIENQDLFSWFLEVFNSGLPKKSFDIFAESIESLDLLIAFSASSFGERSGIFEKIVKNGLNPSDDDVKKFQNYFSQQHLTHSQDAKLFFDKIKKCFKGLKYEE